MRKTRFVFILIPIFLLSAFTTVTAESEGLTWQDETIYYLMVDRFNNGNKQNDFDLNTRDPQAFHGGDIEGIRLQLDYLKEMGFTTIMLTPIFENSGEGYHGFFVVDHFNMDKHYGTVEEFKQLVKEAHERDMKVMIDFVANHVAPNHPWLQEPEKEAWFHPMREISNWDDREELETGWLQGLPDLNQDHPEVREYLLHAAKWWIEETNIDGYHLLNFQHVSVEFWRDFSQEVKQVKEDFYLLADSDQDLLAEGNDYLNIGIDGFFDYQYNNLLKTAFSQPDQSLAPLFAHLNNIDPVHLGQFIDNQQTPRFTNEAVENNYHPGTRWRMALTYLYTTPGTPIIFYGSEIALAGGEVPDNYQQMNFLTDTELIDYIGKIGELRQLHPALTKGSFEMLYEQDGMAVFKREYQDETIVVAINNTSETQNVALPVEQFSADKELRGMLNDDLVRENEDEFRIVIDREEAEIYRVSEKMGFNFTFVAGPLGVFVLFFLFLILQRVRSKQRKS